MIYFISSFMLLILSALFIALSLYFMLWQTESVVEILLTQLYWSDLSLYIYFDWISCLFVGVVFFISSMVVFYSASYMEHDLGSEKFLLLVLLFVFSMFLMVMSPNMIMILLGWDGLGLVSYCLVIFYQNENSNSAGMITVLTNRLGDIGMILSVIFMMNFGSWNMVQFTLSESMMYLVPGLALLGAVTKSAQMPFSAWLPAAMAAPTPVSALVHSSTLVTAGVYLIIRFNVLFNMGGMSELLFFMSVVTMFMSGLSANFETDLKKIIALSTLSQLGVMMMALSVGMYNLAFFHLITHALFKAMLFLCAGVVIHGVGGSQDIRTMGQMWVLSPFICSMMTLASLSLSGFPFLSGFYSKDLILESMYLLNSSWVMMFMIMLATMFTVTYSLRLFYYCMWNNTMKSTVSNYLDSFVMVMPIYLLGGVVVFSGCMMSWMMFPNPVFLFLTMETKMINLFLIFMGLWCFFILFNAVWKSGELGKMVNFYGAMWFLPILSPGIFMKTLEKSTEWQTQLDHGWLEEASGRGLFTELQNSKILFSSAQYLNQKTLVMLIFGVLIILIY